MADPNERGATMGDATNKLATLLGSDPNDFGATRESDEIDEMPDIDNPAEDTEAEVPAAKDESVPEKANAKDDKATEPETAIEPPASWDADAKEHFKKLSPELQGVIAKREADREKGVQAKLQEAAEERKALKAQQDAVANQRTHYETQLLALAQQWEASVPSEFKDIKSQADLIKVSGEDPAKAARFMAWRDGASMIFGQLRQAQQARQEEQERQFNGFVQNEAKKLTAAWPEYGDPVKGKEAKSEISAFLREKGFSDDEISGVADHRIILALKEAVEGRKAVASLKKAQEEAKKKVDATPAKVVTSTKGATAGGGRTLDRANAVRIARGGDRDQTQRALADLLNQG